MNGRFGIIVFSKVFVATLIGIGMNTSAQGKIAESLFRYVITETGPATSFDPLDADSTSNLPVARMLYATPLESSSVNQLESRVLESFKFDPKTRKIDWVVKKDIRYSDGTLITPEDVAFAVARMTYARPTFPVIESIEGVGSWLSNPIALKSLPEGISVDGQKITIRFTKEIEHPLFRFCLELFSIIPKSCVDLTTNKIRCSSIPSSGRYVITKRDEKTILFSKQPHGTDKKAPEKILFEYVKASELVAQIPKFDQQTIAAGSELSFTADELASVRRSLNARFMPAARYAAIHINQEVAPFKDQNCRRLFADAFRKSFSEIYGDDPHEASLFTKILPGYLSMEELGNESKTDTNGNSKCMGELKKTKIPWGFPVSEKDAKFFSVLKKTFERLGIKAEAGTGFVDRKEFAEAFASGRTAFYYGGSGFWALDPAGDVKMLFTPNLHKALEHVSGEKKLRELIDKLDTNPESYRALNRYLYADSRVNVYTHVRRFFASKNPDFLAEVPFAITSPAPWQVFEVRK